MLDLQRVTKTFGSDGTVVRALQDINLTIRPGEFVRIQGPNGSGKTTLLNIIAGSEITDGGRILLDGVDIHNLPEYRRHFAGRIFQDPRAGSCDDLTVLQSLCLSQIGLHPSVLRPAVNTKRKDSVIAALDATGAVHLRHRLNEPLRHLSGGERQIVNVLFLILRQPEPRVVLADEPTNNLDPENARHVLRLLGSFPRSMPVLLVSHENDIEPGVTRVITMRGGAIVDDHPHP